MPTSQKILLCLIRKHLKIRAKQEKTINLFRVRDAQCFHNTTYSSAAITISQWQGKGEWEAEEHMKILQSPFSDSGGSYQPPQESFFIRSENFF